MKLTPEQLQQIECDPRFTTIGTLPSNGKAGYDSFLIRPLEYPELKLFSKALATGNRDHAYRAVDLCVAFPIDELVIHDFHYVMLWLKINSFPNSPYAIEWTCDSPVYMDKETKEILYYSEEWPEIVEGKYEISGCGNENISLVHNVDVSVSTLPDSFLFPDQKEATDPTVYDFPRLKIVREIEELMMDDDRQDEAEELAIIAQAVRWIKGDTLQERIDAIKDDISLLRLGLKMEANMGGVTGKPAMIGLHRTATFRCSRCHSSVSQALDTTFESFFQ